MKVLQMELYNFDIQINVRNIRYKRGGVIYVQLLVNFNQPIQNVWLHSTPGSSSLSLTIATRFSNGQSDNKHLVSFAMHAIWLCSF